MLHNEKTPSLDDSGEGVFVLRNGCQCFILLSVRGGDPMGESLTAIILKQKLEDLRASVSRLPEADAQELRAAIDDFEIALEEADRRYLCREGRADG